MGTSFDEIDRDIEIFCDCVKSSEIRPIKRDKDAIVDDDVVVDVTIDPPFITTNRFVKSFIDNIGPYDDLNTTLEHVLAALSPTDVRLHTHEQPGRRLHSIRRRRWRRHILV